MPSLTAQTWPNSTSIWPRSRRTTKNDNTRFSNVDEYIASFPEAIQPILQAYRALIKEVIPDAEECLSWQMPTYRKRRNIIHFAGNKHHVGIYPGSETIAAFQDELQGYKTAKGTLRITYDQPIPEDLIRKLVAFSADVNQ